MYRKSGFPYAPVHRDGLIAKESRDGEVLVSGFHLVSSIDSIPYRFTRSDNLATTSSRPKSASAVLICAASSNIFFDSSYPVNLRMPKDTDETPASLRSSKSRSKSTIMIPGITGAKETHVG